MANMKKYLFMGLCIVLTAVIAVSGTLAYLMDTDSDVNVMQVIAINKDPSGKASVVLKCTNMNRDLSTVRVEQIELRLKEYEGIRIPDRAIYFNEASEQGVYVQVGNVLQFRRIRVLHHDTREEFTVCAIEKNKKGYVELYDKIVVKGEDLYDGKLVR